MLKEGTSSARTSGAEHVPAEAKISSHSPVWLQARLPPLYPKESAALQLLAAAGDSLFAGEYPCSQIWTIANRAAEGLAH